ncbi:MAG: T9SS type A sorting domain-containing protein, partial [Bacteroidales bacterium]|nr:T9SS type A sorting domain-containing protein [Bacteroidales bacterium]
AYANGRISTWPGLLSTLNQWVEANPRSLDGLSTWMRPTTADINGDLPVLVFAKDNAMGSAGASDKFLRYSAFDLTAGESFDNGIDGLLTAFNKGGNIFLYGNATEVENVPGENTYVFVNEDAVLLQKQGAKAGEFINTTVGVTFDNSDKGAHSFDYYNNKLEYDWHMMSSSLKDANIGATYEGETGYGKPVDIKTLEGSYFPNGLITESNPAIGGDVKWDFYTYFEPEYHWINLKRSGANHWHTDGGAQIQYLSGQEGVAVNNNETIFVPGKGYMMAINKDSYMSNTGELNSGNVKIKLTQQESQAPAPEEAYNEGWNLVGNPYQAYLKMSALGDLGYAAYTYDADKGVYVPFVMTQSDNPEVLADNVHPHQAFFVHAAKDGDVLEFTPEMATTEKNDNSYFRDDKINYPLVNLYAENEGGSRDLTVIELHRPELGGVTKMQTMRSSNFIIAAHLDGQSYGLVFTPEGTERIPVHFIADENGTYTLRWNTQNGEFTSLRLVDNMTGTNYDMLANDHYTFTASTEDYASRFYITYTVTDVDENVDGESNFAYFDGTDWVINGQGTLDVVDVLGRTLFSQRLTNDQNRVNLNGVAKGVYLLRVSNGKNTMVQKIVVR